MASDVRALVTALIKGSDALGMDMAVELIIDTVTSGVGRMGGRPRVDPNALAITKRSVVPPSVRFRVFERDKFMCRYCGRSAAAGLELEIDHVIPVAKGGTNTVGNLVTACAECNVGKGTRDAKPCPQAPSPQAAKPSPQKEPVKFAAKDLRELPAEVVSDPDLDLGEDPDSEKISECGELPAPSPSEPPFLTFPLLGRGHWGLSRARLERYREAYPKLDVEELFRRALSWAESNPSKRKTAKGMPKFLNGWLSREQDKLVANGKAASQRGLHVGHVRITGNEDYGPEGEQQL